MHIYYLSNSLIPSRKANSVQVMKMCQAFSKQGHEVVLFCRKPPKNVKSEDPFHHYGIEKPFTIEPLNFPKIRFISRFLFSLAVIWRMRTYKGEGILYGRDRYLLGFMALLGAIKYPMSFEAHSPPSDGFQTYLQRKVFTHKKFQKLIVISEALEKEYLRLFGDILKGKIIVAHDGADGSQIPPVLLNGQPGLNNGQSFKIGYIGHLYPGKGMETISQLPPLLPDCEFHIVGGTDEDINHWKNTCQYENLIFHGFVPHEQVYDYMAQFHVMLMPYQANVIVGRKKIDIGRWMSPLKLFEYMGGGKPIVASDLPVLREVLSEGENALLANPETPQEWADKIHLLKKDPELREKIRKTAQQNFFDLYTWDKRAELILGEV
ncbi:MAG: glycosyltransferase family 4 protein [Bacteroidetes bacterium]|nr:glycosyltransferase family 4 protein [Bacteroidota bacterium]